MANYVKFRRGLAENFNREEADLDTLYFIYEKDESSADLYLGSKKISSGDTTSATALKQLQDVIIETVTDKDLLIYDSLKGAWVNQSLDAILENLVIDTEPVVKLLTNYLNNEHIDLIIQEFEALNLLPKSGDIIIIKDLIAGNAYKYSSYIYDSSHWCALNENYDINDIYFKNDLIITEAIGTFSPDHTGSAVIPAAGKNLKEVLDSILVKEKMPEVVAPSATIDFIPNKTSYEIGEKCLLQYKIVFNEGAYSYNSTTGVTPSYLVNNPLTSEILTTSEGIFTEFVITDEINDNVTATISYSEGLVPCTNLGTECPSAQILADTISLTAPPIKGFRKAYYGALNNKTELSASVIKTLLTSTNETLTLDTVIKFELPADTMRVIIAYDARLPNLSKVLDENDANTNIISAFGEPQLIKLNGASENTEIDYKVYVLNFARETGVKNWFTATF